MFVTGHVTGDQFSLFCQRGLLSVIQTFRVQHTGHVHGYGKPHLLSMHLSMVHTHTHTQADRSKYKELIPLEFMDKITHGINKK